MEIQKPKLLKIEKIADLRKELTENSEKYEILEKQFKDAEEEKIEAEKYEFRNCLFESCKYIQSNHCCPEYN